MHKKFCPKCGKTVEKLYNNLCADDFLKTLSLEKFFPKKIILKQCKQCRKIYTNKKSAATVEGVLDFFLQEVLRAETIYSASYRVEGQKVHITLRLKYEDLEKEESFVRELVVKNIVCESCNMKNSGYFNSILQLRVPEKVLQIIIDDILNQIDLMRNYNKMAFLGKFEKKKEGVDFYIGSKDVAEQIAKDLKIKYGAEVKKSSKQSGYLRGKKIYRDTILVRLGK
jgi:NMD protein affecting ribosome stability and mRNA decay